MLEEATRSTESQGNSARRCAKHRQLSRLLKLKPMCPSGLHQYGCLEMKSSSDPVWFSCGGEFHIKSEAVYFDEGGERWNQKK